MSRDLTIAGLVALCLGLSVARPASQSRDADTHGRDAKPDYDRVFAQDTVKRLDIRVTAADWSRLTADMTEMAGPFGSDSGVDGAVDSTWRRIHKPSRHVPVLSKAASAVSAHRPRAAAARCCRWAQD